MAFYSDHLAGCTITPSGKVFIQPMDHDPRLDTFEDPKGNFTWTTPPLSTYIDLPLKISNNRGVTDGPEAGESDETEINEHATSVFSDVRHDSVAFGQPPTTPLTGNITVVLVDGGLLHPFVLDFIIDHTKMIIDDAEDRIAQARTRLDKAEIKGLARCCFTPESFHEAFENTREWWKKRGTQPEWNVVTNPFRQRNLPSAKF